MERSSPANSPGQTGDLVRSTLPSRQLELSPVLRKFHRAILNLFLSTGRPPGHNELRAPAAELGLDAGEAMRELARVDLVHADAGGRITVAYPFSGDDRGIHVQQADGPGVWAMCAIDALGIPQMSGRDVVITATDPASHEPVTVESRDGQLTWQPRSAVVLVANNGHSGTSAECLCPLITFHTTEQNALDHLAAQPGVTGQVVSQAKAYELAGATFGSLLTSQPEPAPER
ncbi:MAG TPA: alkylmercury lyase family protein [Streptosporangiaceae bacterium]|nr:alkylmercury lyase family protein [Streptosporangiaceae bacterium]